MISLNTKKKSNLKLVLVTLKFAHVRINLCTPSIPNCMTFWAFHTYQEM